MWRVAGQESQKCIILALQEGSVHWRFVSWLMMLVVMVMFFMTHVLLHVNVTCLGDTDNEMVIVKL